MPLYTTKEKVQIVQWYFSGNSYQNVVDLFAVEYVNRPIPCIQTIAHIVSAFKEFGCVVGNCRKCQRTNEQPEITPDREERDMRVCAYMEMSEPCSSRQVADEIGVSRSTVQRILKRNKYKCYKAQKCQEIFPEDNIERMVFCESVLERANRDENFIKNILFSDESSFPRHGRHNPSVVRYWSRDNKHLTRNVRTQYPEKLNVWAGILGDNIIGPFVINGTLNGVRYLDLLRTQVIPAVTNINVDFDAIWFQQDGCPAHNTRPVMEFLQNTFPGRVIAGKGTIKWPPRSPDLTPCDFFLWGYVKQNLYNFNAIPNLQQLQAELLRIFATITPRNLEGVRREFYDRLGYCLAQEGGIFEPFIK
jgi:predicted DNA-binding protein (UPF0251 family)